MIGHLQAIAQPHRLPELHWLKGIHQPRRGDLVENRQLTLGVLLALHDALGIGLQDAREFDRWRSRQHRHVRVLFDHQRQRPGVIGMRVRDEDVIRPARLGDQAEVGQLVGLDAPAGFG